MTIQEKLTKEFLYHLIRCNELALLEMGKEIQILKAEIKRLNPAAYENIGNGLYRKIKKSNLKEQASSP